MTAALTFVSPPPGLAPHTRFTIEPIDGADGLFSLDAVDDPTLRLHLVDPGTLMPDYAPVLSEGQVDELGLIGPEDAMMLVVASHSPEGVHVNLLAPIVANRITGVAAQVILDAQDYALRAPLG